MYFPLVLSTFIFFFSFRRNFTLISPYQSVDQLLRNNTNSWLTRKARTKERDYVVKAEGFRESSTKTENIQWRHPRRHTDVPFNSLQAYVLFLAVV